MAASHRSLADSLRDLDRDELTRLLTERPDLASPVPEGLNALAARAASAGSARRALHSLSLPQLQTAQALAILGGAASRAQIAHALGDPAAEHLDPLLARLRLLALAWEDGEYLRLVRPLIEHLSASAGLAPALPDDPDPAAAQRRVESAPESLRPVFDALAWGPRHADGSGPLAQALLEAGILAADGERLRIPRTVHLALRGGRVQRELALHPPELETTPAAERFAGSRAAAAAEAAQRAVNLLDSLRQWPQDPPPVLRRGGLPQRDLRRLAAAQDCPIDAYAAVMQTAWAAGWVVGGELEFAPGRDPEAERLRPTQDRWAELAEHWLALAHVPSRVGTRGEDGHPRALFSDALRSRGVAERRRRALELLASADGARVDEHSLREALHWCFPLLGAEEREEETAAVLAEGAALGLVADGALTVLGRALLTGPDAAAEALAQLLPPVVDEVVVAGDLTVTVPGRPSARLAGLVDWGAVLSRGGAIALSLDARSLQAQMERGGDLDALLALLEDASRTPLPQALLVAAEDARRRHGQVRVGRVPCLITASEEVLERLLVAPEAQKLQLRRLAPTIAASTQGPPAVLAAVRAAGLSPQEVGIDGAPAAVRRRPSPTATEVLEATPSEAADLILRAEEGCGPAGVIGRLQAEIDTGEEARERPCAGHPRAR